MKIVEDICVGIQGRVDVPVAEPGLEDYGSHAGIDTAGRECVSQTMLAVDGDLKFMQTLLKYEFT